MARAPASHNASVISRPRPLFPPETMPTLSTSANSLESFGLGLNEASLAASRAASTPIGESGEMDCLVNVRWLVLMLVNGRALRARA